MKKYSVGVDYTASIYIKVKANSPEEAEEKAMRIAYQEIPYSDLIVETHYVEQMDENDNDDEYQENDDE
jgi:SHS2 domain-containing protein